MAPIVQVSILALQATVQATIPALWAMVRAPIGQEFLTTRHMDRTRGSRKLSRSALQAMAPGIASSQGRPSSKRERG